jgi:hypothetical protein
LNAGLCEIKKRIEIDEAGKTNHFGNAIPRLINSLHSIKKGMPMTINHRFFLREQDHIIDKLNPIHEIPSFVEKPENEAVLRERVLWNRLFPLVDALIVNNNPMVKPPNGEEYQPYCEEAHSISWSVYKAIEASHINTVDVALSIQHRFNGELKREKVGWQDVTSLSLFADDVERLLRDLYGEPHNEAIDRARSAVFVIVEEFTKFVRNDVWQEHQDAVNVDYINGIGVPDGYGLGGTDFRRGIRSAQNLKLRAHAVRANSTAFSKYTVMFVDELFAKMRSLDPAMKETTFELDSSAEEIPF